MHSLPLRQRRESRHLPLHRGVAWSRAGGGAMDRGRLTDTSRSGLGMDVPWELAPQHGEVLRIHSMESSEQRRVRVVRVEVGPRGMIRVGCGCVSAREYPNRPCRPGERRFESGRSREAACQQTL